MQTAETEASQLLESLDVDQRQAVSAPLGNHLVLAGAGSGKTRVLVHRVAWLVSVEQLSPYSILAVTFTNKAAAEMRSRIESLLGMRTSSLWVGTFHGLAHRLLRLHWQEAGLSSNFQILDADDQKRMVRRVIQSMQLDERKWPPSLSVSFINRHKDEGLRPEQIDPEGDPVTSMHTDIYRAYEEACQRGGVVDFAELLLRSHELWLNAPDLLRQYQERFQYLLVDEFQDTNAVQYAWLRVLAGKNSNIMVVGDDDQSIYGWRGARIENIHQFSRDFANTQTIRLQRNYRSTGNILKAANQLISQNTARLGKELWTEDGDGDLITSYRAFNEIDEARFVVSRIAQQLDQGSSRREFAILYRTNAQSRVLEEELLRVKLPYRIHGGQRFFDRLEIRNAVSYLRLMDSRDADVAFERVVNTPPRRIGNKTVSKLRSAARSRGTSLWNAAWQLLSEGALTPSAAESLQSFLTLVDKLDKTTQGQPLDKITEKMLKKTGLREFHGKEKGEKGISRVENLNELITAAGQFDGGQTEEETTLLAEFLHHASLDASEGEDEGGEDCIRLMTLHSAKGLEFPFVFITGVEQGLFPSNLAVAKSLEEERRLCYVGITRAMKRLTLTYAEMRRIKGSEVHTGPSRFLSEISPELMNEVRPGSTLPKPHLVEMGLASTSLATEEVPGTSMRLGEKVRHRKFGEGVILNFEGEDNNMRVQVRFDTAGSKWLMLSYAGLEPAI